VGGSQIRIPHTLCYHSVVVYCKTRRSLLGPLATESPCRTTLQVFVTYLTGALYVHPLWFYKHQHDNRVRSTLFVACQRWWFQWRFAAILVNCAPSGEMHNYCTPHIIKENSENFLIHRCNYILLSQVYCVWQVVKTPTIILNNPLLRFGKWCIQLTKFFWEPKLWRWASDSRYFEGNYRLRY
jgi:hypothetical protein